MILSSVIDPFIMIYYPLDLVLKQLEIEKLQGLKKHPEKYERQGNSTTYNSNTATLYTTRTQ